MQIELYKYSAIGNRAVNEDSVFGEKIGPQSACAVVCDGLGGHGGGKDASQIGVNALKWEKGDFPSESELQARLEAANREIIARRSDPRQMKTTAVALYISGNQARWCHVGDSRLYHYYNGQLWDFTEDHSVCQVAVRMGEITRREIPGHPDRSKILRALGSEDLKPEIHKLVTLDKGFHAFLLCTDGLWERLQEDEIMLDLHKAANPEQWIYDLRVRAEARKHTDVDNNTAVALYVMVD